MRERGGVHPRSPEAGHLYLSSSYFDVSIGEGAIRRTGTPGLASPLTVERGRPFGGGREARAKTGGRRACVSKHLWTCYEANA